MMGDRESRARNAMHTISRVIAVIVLSVLYAQADATNLYFVTESFAPFTYEEGGKAAGPFVAVIQSVCANIKAECRFEVFPWRRALMLAKNGEADGIFTMLNYPERAQEFNLSVPIAESSYALYALQENKFIYKNEQDLAGHTIGVYGPSGTSITLENMVRKIHGANIVLEIDNARALRLLSAGAYGGDGLAMVNHDVAHFIFQNKNITNLREVANVGKAQYCIGFSKKTENPKYRKQFEQFNDELKAQISSGMVKAILDKYGMKLAR
jgi:polar amino acid transport system substrate-binding protein